MISYKKINLLDLRLIDGAINNKETLLEIKSPIMNYEVKDSEINLILNKYSDAHNSFANICGYICRLFKITDIPCDCVKPESITMRVTSDSKVYNIDSKAINFKTLKKEGKMICSFVCDNGNMYLKNLLLVKG